MKTCMTMGMTTSGFFHALSGSMLPAYDLTMPKSFMNSSDWLSE